MLPKERSLDEKSEELKRSITGNLKTEAIDYINDITKVLKGRNQKFIEWEFYIGFRLLKRADATGNAQDALEQIKTRILELFLSDGRCLIPAKKEAENKKLEDMLYKSLRSKAKIRRVTNAEMQYLFERNFIRGMEESKRGEIVPGYSLHEKNMVIDGIDISSLTKQFIDTSFMNSLKLDNGEDKTYVAFLTASYIPDAISLVGDEFLYYLENFDFTVEVSIRVKMKENKSAIKQILSNKDSITEEINFAEDSGKTPSVEAQEAEEELREAEYYLKKSRIPLMEVFFVFAVSAKTEDDLKSRVSHFKAEYSTLFEFVLEQPRGNQMSLFNEFLPGAEVYVMDYKQIVEPKYLAAGGFGATKILGTETGFYIATTEDGLYPVYLDPSLGAQNIEGSITNCLSIAILGKTGFGKSMFINLLIYLIALSGGMSLTLDRKNERTNWSEDLPDIAEWINIVTLYSTEEYRGLLDPFYILDLEAAKVLALSILMNILGLSIQDEMFGDLSDVIEKVSRHENPNMTKIMEYALDSKDIELQKIGKRIRGFSKVSFAVLLFGIEKPEKTISLDSAINIIQIQNLSMPKAGTPVQEYTLENMLSVALMKSISGWERKFLNSDRNTYKLVVSEEAWASISTEEGNKNAHSGVKEGRALNSGYAFILQNVSELGGSAIKNNIGLKFAFHVEDREEAIETLKFFGLKDTEENIEMLHNLETGYCLFQDFYGRVGVIYIDLVFLELFNAFDTKPPKQK